MTKLAVSVVTADDPVWLLPVWAEALPLLRERYRVVGLHVVPDHLSTQRGLEVPLWYLRRFGPRAFVLLAIFAVLRRWQHRALSWERLGAAHGLPVLRWPSPNRKGLARWLREHEVDVGLLTCGHIVRRRFLRAHRLGVINKHAALLPRCKGLLPYISARRLGVPLGVSYHRVDEGIDTGGLLLQEAYPDGTPPASMLGFYKDVFAAYPTRIVEAIEALREDRRPAPLLDGEGEYATIPDASEMADFWRAGGTIARWEDLWDR